MRIEVRKLSPTTKDDFYNVNCQANGLGWCNCVAWWCPTWDEFKDRTEAENRKQRETLFSKGEYDGYVLYVDGAPVGWSQVGLRDRLQKLYSQYGLESSPETIAISCIALAPSVRGNGIAHHFVQKILEDLRSQGVRHVQAFPKRNTDDPWTGPESVFVKAGFSLEKNSENFPVYGISWSRQ
jgi:GNAT superfamily N-acetyltransferase